MCIVYFHHGHCIFIPLLIQLHYVFGLSIHCAYISMCMPTAGSAFRKSIRPVKIKVLVWLSVWSEVQIVCIWSS